MKKITILGDGGWGTALALTTLQNNTETTLWGPFEDNIEAIRTTHKNRFLPGVDLPENLKATSSISEAVQNAEIVVLASPSQFMRGTLNMLREYFVPEQMVLVNVAKGIETDTLKCMHEICAEILGDNLKYVTLSGPSHAEEVARGIPTAVVSASENIGLAKLVQETFMTRNFRIYTSRDVISVELGGALKNVLAIAAGILDGMQLGDNPKAALMTRGIAEMARLGVALGGKRETFAGLSGIGDLIVTCMSRHSRNRHVGEELGRGKTLEQITSEMGMVVAEGVKTAISAHMLAQRKNCETPIINAVFNVLYNNLSAKDAAYGLMTREPRDEED